jgi:hypothetical protein
MFEQGSTFSQIIGTSLASFLLALLFLRIYLPFAPKRPGNPIGKIRLGLREKVLIFRPTLIPMLLLLFVNQIPVSGIQFAFMLPGTELMIMLAIVVAAVVPVSYIFTTDGYALSNGQAHKWESFRRYEVENGVVVLEGKGERPTKQKLYIPAEKENALRTVLKRFVS